MIWRKWISIGCCGIGISFAVSSAARAATITVGQVQLLANQPGQWVDVSVSGGDAVAGIDFFLQLGDGGPQLANFGLPPGRPGPNITAVELKSDTIFQNVTDVPFNVGSPELPQVAVYTLALVGASPTVSAHGILAKVQVDTTGFFGGSWDLKLDNVLPFGVFGGPHTTNFAGVAADIQNGSVSIPIVRGDYNGNQQFDVADVDQLAAAIRAGSTDRSLYDLNSDNSVNVDDHGFWVQKYAHVYYGDADFDGRFVTSDLVQVFVEGKYEDAAPGNANWGAGDWNGDGDFDSGDLVIAFQAGGYELGSQPAIRPARLVPEPFTLGPSLAAGLGLILARESPRRRKVLSAPAS